MRNEYQTMRLVTKIAENDVRIRAVVMSSAARIPFPGAQVTIKADLTQDFRLADKHPPFINPAQDAPLQKTNFDIIYLVTDLKSLVAADFFINTFGRYDVNSKVITEYGEKCQYILPLLSGNQITLHVVETNNYKKNSDALIEILMDKDNLFPNEHTPSDITYWEKRPDKATFNAACTEFWWLMIYTARVLSNGDLLYAMERLNLSSEGTHPQLIRMLTWYVGVLVNFSESVGKCGRYLQNFLPEDMWESLMKTYPTAGDVRSIWNVVLETCDLFAKTSTAIAKSLNFDYPPELFNYCVTYVHQLMEKDL